MKILAISDAVDQCLYTPHISERFRDIALVLCCGDLPNAYLEYIVSSLNVPLYYVPGNHDPAQDKVSSCTGAEGCVSLDRKVIRVKGLWLAGLGGSLRYRSDGVNQYTQAEMVLRMMKILPRCVLLRLLNKPGLDILVTHAPPRGVHDDNDQAHTGFNAFSFFLRMARPRYLLHGHVLVYKRNLEQTMTRVGRTTVINILPSRLIEIEPQ